MINKLKEFIYLGRFNSPTGALLLAYPCLWGIALSKPSIIDLIIYTFIFLLGSFCMRAAGCAWNDIVDREIDKQVSRTKNRPIASGKISIKEGLIFILFNCLLGLVILFSLPFNAILIALFSILLVIIYPLTKRITYFPQIWLGITFNIGLLIGFTALNVNFPQIYIYLMYLGAIFWTVAYDTIYAIQDYKDDLKLNIKSTTVKMKSYSGAFSSICYIFFILIFCSGLLIGEYGLMSIFPIMTVGIWQAYDAFRSKVENISKAKKHFLYQNLTGLIIWISIIYDSKFLEH